MKCVNNSKLFNGPVRNRDFGEKIVFVPYISFVGCNLPGSWHIFALDKFNW